MRLLINTLKLLPLGVLLPLIIAAASVRPDDAFSNLAQWVQWVGVKNLPDWAWQKAADAEAIRISVWLVVFYIFAVWLVPAINRRVRAKWHAFRKKPSAPVVIRSHKGIIATLAAIAVICVLVLTGLWVHAAYETLNAALTGSDNYAYLTPRFPSWGTPAPNAPLWIRSIGPVRNPVHVWMMPAEANNDPKNEAYWRFKDTGNFWVPFAGESELYLTSMPSGDYLIDLDPQNSDGWALQHLKFKIEGSRIVTEINEITRKKTGEKINLGTTRGAYVTIP